MRNGGRRRLRNALGSEPQFLPLPLTSVGVHGTVRATLGRTFHRLIYEFVIHGFGEKFEKMDSDKALIHV